MRFLCVMVVAVCFASSAVRLHAAMYLNGVVNSRVDAFGNNAGEPAEYDSFNTTNLKVFMNFNTAPVLLSGGTNVISISGGPLTFGGLGLFITDFNVPLDAATNFGRVPDLYVFRDAPPPIAPPGFDPPLGFAPTLELTVPAAGIQVATLGVNSGNAPYSGAEFFDIGGQRISITDWNGSTLSLSVTPVPEPSSLAIIAAGVTSALYRRMKRRKNNQTAI